MPRTLTGAEYARKALVLAGIIDPTEPGEAEDLQAALDAGADLLDSWANDRLLVSGVTRHVHSLVAGTQTYTLGDGATLDQEVPAELVRWGVIPDDSAAIPTEQGRGRPSSDQGWSAIQAKSTTGNPPQVLWFDPRIDDSGFARVHVWPIPTVNTVDLVLYGKLPSILTLEENTSYTLQRGFARVIKLGIALELMTEGGYEIDSDNLVKIKDRFDDAMARLQRANHQPRVTPVRREWALLGGRRRYRGSIRTLTR